MDSKAELRVLKSNWDHCDRCGLHERRGVSKKIVFGAGPADAEYFFLYETPSEADETTSHPLTGEEGSLLLDLLDAAEIPTEKVFFAPLIGCRPSVVIPATDDSPEQIADKEPTKEEIKACLPRILEQIYLVDPRVIFASGRLAWQTLVKPKDRGTHTSLDKALSYVFDTWVPGRIAPQLRYPVYPLLSMKQIRATPSYAPHGALATTIDNLTRGRLNVEYLKKAEVRDAKQSGK